MEVSAKKEPYKRANECGYSEAAEKISERIKELRKNYKLSQDEFCDKLSDFGFVISASTLSRYEYSKCIIPSDFLWVLATYLQCDITYLLTGERKKDRELRATLFKLLQE